MNISQGKKAENVYITLQTIPKRLQYPIHGTHEVSYKSWQPQQIYLRV